MKWIEENGWGIFSGCIKRDKKREYTFTGGKGNMTIDYVLGHKELRERIESMTIEDRIDSDHHPVKVKCRSEEVKRRRRKKEKVWRGIWDQKKKKILKENRQNRT